MTLFPQRNQLNTFYVASRLENIEKVKHLIAALRQIGMLCTYDWTEHGPVYDRGREGVMHVASAELTGVRRADIVIVWLPGGRGTHVELGAAIAMRDVVGHAPNIYLVGTEADFECDKNICAFYLHPNVVRLLITLEHDEQHQAHRIAEYIGTLRIARRMER